MGEGKFGGCSSAVFTSDSNLMKWEVMQDDPQLFTDEHFVKKTNQMKSMFYSRLTVTWTLSNYQFCAADKVDD